MSDSIIERTDGVFSLTHLDHPIVEAIRDESGQPSILRLARLVDGYRRHEVVLDTFSASDLTLTELLAGIKGAEEGQPLSWGKYAGVLATAITIE